MRAYPHAADGWSLSAASDSVGAALGGAEGGYFGDVVGGDGDYYELCDVVAGCDVLCGVAGVMQADFDGAAIPLINNAGAVAEYEAPFNSGAAAYKQHAYMAFRYGHVNTGVAYAVATHGDCQVVG